MIRFAPRALATIVSLSVFTSVASAQEYPQVRFVPPIPGSGSTNTPALNPAPAYNAGNVFNKSQYFPVPGSSNDGFSVGRGIVFTPDQTTNLRSVGIVLNVTNIQVNFIVALAGATQGNINQGAILRQGAGIVNNNNSLQFVNFGFENDPLVLEQGQAYHVEFSFLGDPEQNLFYDTRTTTTDPGFAWSQGTQGVTPTFSNIRGTLNETTNPVSAGIGLNFTFNSVVQAPEPGAFALLGVGLGVMALRLRRRA